MAAPSFDSDQLVIGGTATIYVAPSTTTLPTHVNSVLDPQFLSLGYTTEDGVKFMDEKTIEEIRAHQSFYAIRRIVTARNATAEFTMLEWDRKTVSLAFGGGTWSTPTAGVYNYDPPTPETIDERVMVIDIGDGDETWRIIIPKGMVTSNTESTFTRTGPALLPITFGVLGQVDVSPWKFSTDSTAAEAVEAGS